MPSIIQFLHPGGEAKPDSYPHKTWSHTHNKNCKPISHSRKFALNAGKYVCDIENELKEQESEDMMFWCEWEPESTVINPLAKTSKEHPEYLYELWWQSKVNYAGLHNTDPFIFEGPFKYYNCRQKNKNLQKLAPGSIILFGSNKDSQFVLDTVFVVGQKVPYSLCTYPQDFASAKISLSQTFDSVCMRPTVAPKKATLYEGVHFNQREQYCGMFSFFPCLPNKNNKGFARPIINATGVLSNIIKPGLRQNLYANKFKVYCEKDCKNVWDEVVKQVIDDTKKQGLCLGIEATTPGERSPNSSDSTSEHLPSSSTSSQC